MVPRNTLAVYTWPGTYDKSICPRSSSGAPAAATPIFASGNTNHRTTQRIKIVHTVTHGYIIHVIMMNFAQLLPAVGKRRSRGTPGITNSGRRARRQHLPLSSKAGWAMLSLSWKAGWAMKDKVGQAFLFVFYFSFVPLFVFAFLAPAPSQR